MPAHALARDDFAMRVVEQGADPRLGAILQEVCRITGMGFAAVACVTHDRWIACQVLDRIEFGLEPGGELDVATTICKDIRECGRMIVIDHVDVDKDWRTHPTPTLYGFKSYASFPVVLEDGSFYGTLCAIDPQPRLLKDAAKIAALENCAGRVAAILSDKLAARQD